MKYTVGLDLDWDKILKPMTVEIINLRIFCHKTYNHVGPRYLVAVIIFCVLKS